MNSAGRATTASVYRWRVASGFCAVVTFTIVAGYYLPAHRNAVRLRNELALLKAEHSALSSELERTRSELAQSQTERERLRRELESGRGATRHVERRIEKLESVLTAQFGRLVQAKMLVVSSAGDRASVALAVPVLFASGRTRVTPNGRSLLCELASSIMAVYSGQIRVTGYYGKARIDEPGLSSRHPTPWHLSSARAASAVEVLEQGCGAPTDRFLVVGYGPRAAGPLGENVALELIFRPGD